VIYQEWEQEIREEEQRRERSLILRQLTRQIGQYISCVLYDLGMNHILGAH
jgi:hypothetical protein